ncbi:hypothetical protein [uncultured Mediterranean phage uvMED]|nr:hypothetical protein [uncultured Mediterranean phage uvMED]
MTAKVVKEKRVSCEFLSGEPDDAILELAALPKGAWSPGLDEIEEALGPSECSRAYNSDDWTEALKEVGASDGQLDKLRDGVENAKKRCVDCVRKRSIFNPKTLQCDSD